MPDVTIVLVVLLLFLNGATDAANAMASAVASGAMTRRQAALTGAVCNLLGGLAGSAFLPQLRRSVLSGADFGSEGRCGAAAALGAAVLFTAAAWLVRIPTSESHALLSAAAGASSVLGAGNNAQDALLPVLFWMALSFATGLLGGILCTLMLPRRFPARGMQRLCAIAASFLHGMQDLTKFLALLPAYHGMAVPLLAAGVMSLGTLCGGRMMDAMGDALAHPGRRGALGGELGAAAALTLLSLMGIPASTSQVKAASCAGAAMTDADGTLHGKALLRFALGWLGGLPVCFLLARHLARCFRLFF